MSLGLISVVIPTFNYGRFVVEAVASALDQTYTNREVIVVDDGSTDGTRAVLAPYIDRVRYLYQENQGLSAARNTGIGAARGEWVALLDSDDVWHPRKLEVQARSIGDHPEAGLVASGSLVGAGPPWPTIDLQVDAVATPISYEDLVFRSRFGPSGVLVRKACFDSVGLFDHELSAAEDRDMWLRLARRYPVDLLDTPLWWYRVHGASMSRNAILMEANEEQVLRKALSGGASRRLRRRAFSHAAFSAAFMYEEAGLHSRAMTRMLRSIRLWPWPYQRADVRTGFARPKLLARIGLELLSDLEPRSPMGPTESIIKPGRSTP